MLHKTCGTKGLSANTKRGLTWAGILVTWTSIVYYLLALSASPWSENGHLSPASFESQTVSPDKKCTCEATEFRKPAMEAKSSPLQHVYYLKNHKTGSTSTYFILAEYCRSRQLLPLLPRGVHINQRLPFHPSQVMLDPQVQKYDMVFNHQVYSDGIFQYLHNDTFRFTTLREPLAQFLSAFYYFRQEGEMEYLKQIAGVDPLKEFLAHPAKYEVKGYSSYTNNRQSVDLGYSLKHAFNDSQYIQTFIAQSEKRFSLILITEHFDESVILLKRALRWQTGDVIYYKKLARSKNTIADLTDVHRQQHRAFSTADIALYNHFLNIFKQKISQEYDLSGEVEEFKKILEKVYTFCDRKNVTAKQLIIPSGRWSDEVIILRSKCKWLTLTETAFTRHLQKRQQELLSM